MPTRDSTRALAISKLPWGISIRPTRRRKELIYDGSRLCLSKRLAHRHIDTSCSPRTTDLVQRLQSAGSPAASSL